MSFEEYQLTWFLTIGPSPTPSHQLPQEEVRTQQPAPPEEEAEVDLLLVTMGQFAGIVERRSGGISVAWMARET